MNFVDRQRKEKLEQLQQLFPGIEGGCPNLFDVISKRNPTKSELLSLAKLPTESKLFQDILLSLGFYLLLLVRLVEEASESSNHISYFDECLKYKLPFAAYGIYGYASLIYQTPSQLLRYRPLLDIKIKRRILLKLKEQRAMLLGILLKDGWSIGRLEEISTDDASMCVERDFHVMQTIETNMHPTHFDFNPSLNILSEETVYVEAVSVIEMYNDAKSTVLSVYGPPPTAYKKLFPVAFAGLIAFIIPKVFHLNVASLSTLWFTVKDTVFAFTQDWIIQPTVNILNTIRHRERRLALLGAQTVQSDFDSLERMVVEFAKDTHAGLSEGDMNDIVLKTRSGDLSVLLKQYEHELKNPIHSALFGDLIRILLIQVHKSKVDLELSMDALDKLLKSNELNFGLMALTPSLIIAWFVGRWTVNSIKSASFSISRRKAYKGRLRSSLRILSKHLSAPVSEYLTQGLIIIETQSMREYARFVFSDPLLSWFNEDLSDLENAAFDVARKWMVLERIYKYFHQ